MKIKVQSIHFDADMKLIGFIEEKVNRLTHFFHDVIEGEVFLRIDKAHSHHNKVTEIKLNVPGKILFAKEQCSSFEEATDTAVEAIKKQLTKHKDKVKNL